MEMERGTYGILFADVKGYSKLTLAQLETYLTQILPDLASRVIDHYRKPLHELNTWGDGIVAASRDPIRLAEFALDLRDFFVNQNWARHMLPKLEARIGIHAGLVFFGHDPIRQKDGIIGTNVILAARIEPITSPGDIWVTETFFRLIDDNDELSFVFDDLGEQHLAKEFGIMRLYRLRRPRDAAGALANPSSSPQSSSQPAEAAASHKASNEFDVYHPLEAMGVRGPLHKCKFHIMTPRYKQKGRWKSLADVLVEVIGGLLPDKELGREVYLIPSAGALPKLRDARILREDAELLQKKRVATERFIKEWEHGEPEGAWFTHPTKKGQGVGVYSHAYDKFLNESLANDRN
jgi:class 3 adenylate cyclase